VSPLGRPAGDALLLAAALPWSGRRVPHPAGETGAEPPTGRAWLVVSPHLDDGVLSLGASIARHVAGGGRVTVLTALAGRPEAPGPAGPWDARAGFHLESEATAARRLEDQRACAVVGAEVAHVDGGDDQYDPERDPGPLLEAVDALVGGHDEVLLPGFPLFNGDHRWVADTVGQLLVGRGVAYRYYAEEPYAAEGKPVHGLPHAPGLPDGPRWAVVRPGTGEQLRKLRAVARYETQLPLLAHAARVPTPGGTAARALGLVWSATRRGEWISSPLGQP
jgi:LmbE family N-acetylglucosaminyl deacetylase